MFGVARKVAGRMLHRWSEERMRVCLEWMGVTGKDAIADSGWAHLLREGEGKARYSRLWRLQAHDITGERVLRGR